MHDLFAQVGNGEIPAIPSHFSEGVKQILGRMLDSDHQNRPTAQELLREKIFDDATGSGFF